LQKRILLARPDHLGDVLLTLPAVAALRRALPDARICCLVAPGAGDVPRRCSDVDETDTVPFPPLTGPAEPPGWADIVAQRAAVLRGRFDLALLPRHDDPWSGALAAAAGIPIRLGYDHPRTHRFLTAALPIPERRHVAAQATDLAVAAAVRLGAPAAVGVEVPPEGHFAPTAAEQAEADGALAGAIPAVGSAPLVLHPGSGWRLKNWPPDRWGALAAGLERRSGVTPLVVGGPRERELVDAVVEASARRAHGLAGRLSLGGLAGLHRRARLVVAADSGPLHLAAMMGTPVVGLYGPVSPLEFGPLCPPGRCRVVRVQLPCSPCGTLLDPPCGARAAPACVSGIGVEAVLIAAAELL
jgi:ADP-heptose:LPS heptosyltransferase